LASLHRWKRHALRNEFIAAIAFLAAMGRPLLVAPGNHDIPSFDLYSRFPTPDGGGWRPDPPAS